MDYPTSSFSSFLKKKKTKAKEEFKAVKKKLKNDYERLKSANSHFGAYSELLSLFQDFCRNTGLGSSTCSDIRTFLRLYPAFFLTFFLQGHMLRRLLSALFFDCNKWLNLQKYKKNGNKWLYKKAGRARMGAPYVKSIAYKKNYFFTILRAAIPSAALMRRV